MPVTFLTGPPGSGKTELLLSTARRFCAEGKRVLWIGLPQQRNHILNRLAGQGGVVGFEFISEQQLCYRLLSRARRLRPLRIGTERLALIGAVLAEVQEAVPMPGEARLFASAIAELKRNGLAPGQAAALAFDSESSRLAEVYARYEEHKGDAWDYDDYRSQALQLAQQGQAESGADLLIVSGYRELLPMTMELYLALARVTELKIALPELPELPAGTEFSQRQPAGQQPAQLDSWRAPNEVEEARWVMRSIKKELAAGTDMSELALVVPAGQLWAWLALAEDYGLPLMPELSRSLADTRAGHMLLELMSLADDTLSPSALLVLPGLEQLAATALQQRLSGRAALLELAERLDARAAAEASAQQEGEAAAEPPASLQALLLSWLKRIGAGQPGLDWAAELVALVSGELADGDAELAAFEAQALQRAREAARLGEGQSFRAWWAALLEDTRQPLRENAGIALLTPDLVSGRRYRRAWLAAALEGNYLPALSEDYFLPEELRSTEALTGQLPRRFTAGNSLRVAELLQLAGRITITWAESSQGGQNTPQHELVGLRPTPLLPELEAGNTAELQSARSAELTHDLEASRVRLPRAEVQWLLRYGECPHREWTTHLLRRSGDLPEPELNTWQQLRRELSSSGRLTEEDLAGLAARHSWAADWLGQHSALLLQLHFGLYLPLPKRVPLKARVDAAGRLNGQFSIFRFTGPDEVADAAAATRLISGRQAERWLASYMLDAASEPEPLVRLFAWPLGGAPLEAGVPGGQDLNQRWVRSGLGELDDHLETYFNGTVAPRPGFVQCRTCQVRDFCRRGVLR